MSETEAAAPPAAKPEAKRLPPSPCVGICTMAADDLYCMGCGRTTDEITDWPTLDEDAKRAAWQAFPGRLAGLGIKIFRLAAEPDQIARFVAQSLRRQNGTWAIGGLDAAVAFTPIGAVDVDDGAAAITAIDTAGNGLRIAKNGRVRAFGLAPDGGTGEMRSVALMLPRRRAEFEIAETVAALGADGDAIRDSDRDLQRFDFASGQAYARASLRTGDAELIARCQALCGATGGIDRVAEFGGADDAARLIFETAMGRVEVAPAVRPEVRAPGIAAPGAFAATAVFTTDDPAWLAVALAP